MKSADLNFRLLLIQSYGYWLITGTDYLKKSIFDFKQLLSKWVNVVVASSVVSTLFLLPYFEIHGYKFVKSYANDCWTMKIDFEINLRSLSCPSEWAAIEATAKHTISNKKNMVMRPTNTWRWEVSNNKKVKCHRIQKNEVTLSWVSHKLAEGYTKRYMPLSQNLWHWKLSNL